MLRVVLLQPRHPPQRMVPLRTQIASHGLLQRTTFAQKAAQTSVDERRLRARGVFLLGSLHCLVDQRKGRIGRVFLVGQQRQRAAQQCIHRRCWRARRQLLAHRFSPAQRAQHLKQQRLHAGPQCGWHPLQHCRTGAAPANFQQRAGHFVQLLRQRHAGGVTGRAAGACRSNGPGQRRGRTGSSGPGRCRRGFFVHTGCAGLKPISQASSRAGNWPVAVLCCATAAANCARACAARVWCCSQRTAQGSVPAGTASVGN